MQKSYLRKMNKDNLKRTYTFYDRIQLAYFLFRTKLIDKRIRLIRFPIVIRGRKYIDFGNHLTTGFWCRFESYPQDDNSRIHLKLGDNIQMNDYCHICAIDKVEIGDNCLFASHIYISDNSHGRYEGGDYDSCPEVAPDHREYVTAPVKIGKNCWLGEGVIVMPGVTIGDGCIIGAHSIVNKDIPDACIAVGSPAKIVKRFNFEAKRWQRI